MKKDLPEMSLEVEQLSAAVRQEPSEANLVHLLDQWSAGWKHKGRTRAIGPGAYEKYCTLGLYAHGGIAGISRASDNEAACSAVNHFLRNRFPNGTWTSIAILCNPKIGVHRDILNMKGHPNHAITVGSFTGGRVWVEDDDGKHPAQVTLRKKVRPLIGTWHDIHDKPITFDARRFHQLEPHLGHMWALAAYTPQAFKHVSDELSSRLDSLGFPSPSICRTPLEKSQRANCANASSATIHPLGDVANHLRESEKAKAIVHSSGHLQTYEKRSLPSTLAAGAESDER